jgi:hypothetical protein
MPPLTTDPGARADLRQLHQWVWLQYLTEGIRVLALAGRWNDAVTHATSLNGVGLHLMDGRQATVIAHLLNGEAGEARNVMGETASTQPWEQQVEACLVVLCAEPHHVSARVSTMIEHFVGTGPVPGYAVFRARLGITVAKLADVHGTDEAEHVFGLTASEAISSRDGYAAREVLNHRTGLELHVSQLRTLSRIVKASGLGVGALTGTALQSLAHAVEAAEHIAHEVHTNQR